MFKYKNISDFRQSLTVKGRRILLKPDDVVESDTELKYVFLEPVDASVPVTATGANSVTKRVDDLAQKLEGLEKEKEELAKSQAQEIYDTVEEVDRAVKDLQTKYNDLTGIIKLLKQSVDTAANKADALEKTNTEDKKLYLRRLEMLKSAVMTIETEVFGPSEDTSGK